MSDEWIKKIVDDGDRMDAIMEGIIDITAKYFKETMEALMKLDLSRGIDISARMMIDMAALTKAKL